MACHVKMKRMFMRGLLWLLLFGFGYMALSLEPGYLDFDNLPDTNFSCVGKVIGGYYADLETNCQMFHVCTIGQLDEPMDIRFLCLNGTVFDQETRVCERIDEVDCSKSEQFYSLNLELYGNTQPPIVEDSPETEPPIIIKASTTTTTTTTQGPKSKTTRPAYFTTATPSLITTSNSKVISTHHFPISSSSDIRFNPEEINISLNPGAAPSIRTKPTSFQQQIFDNDEDAGDINHHNNNKKAIVTTHITYGDDKEEVLQVQRPHPASTTDRPKIPINYGRVQDDVTPSEINYEFNYDHQPSGGSQYQTEVPHRNYQYHHSNLGLYRPGIPQYRHQFKTTTYRTEHISSTRKHPYHTSKQATTYRSPFLTSLKPAPSYHTYNTEKPERLQLPLPVLPTLPPLTFSTPAPFTLSRHVEAKRYTNDHQQPPRIIISASASVSDASGRRLNYSLGTIGVTPLLDHMPKSYDDYKEHDVVLDPFYHDVPKVKSARRKRSLPVGSTEPSVSIKEEEESVDILKFLFKWYKDHENAATATTIPEGLEAVLEINDKLAPENSTVDIRGGEALGRHNDSDYSDLFKRGSKYNIVGDVLAVTEAEMHGNLLTISSEPGNDTNSGDYIDDNYESVVYKEHPKENKTAPNDKYDKHENVSEQHQNQDSDYDYYYDDYPEEELKNNEDPVKSETPYESTGPKEVDRQVKAVVSHAHKALSSTTEALSTSTETVTEYADSTERATELSYEDAAPDTIPQKSPKMEEDTTLYVIIKKATPKLHTDKELMLTTTETSPLFNSEEDEDVEEGAISTTPQIYADKNLDFNWSTTDAQFESTTPSGAEIEYDATTTDYPIIKQPSNTVMEVENADEHWYTTTEDTLIPTTDSPFNKQLTTEAEDGTTLANTRDEIVTTPFSLITTTPTTTTTESQTRPTRRKSYNWGGRPPRYKPQAQLTLDTPKFNVRHRFGAESRPSKPNRRKFTVSTTENEQTHTITTTDSASTAAFTTTEQAATTDINVEDVLEDVPATDAPLYRSANPTQAERDKTALHTTPLSMVYKIQVRREKLRSFIFNCFGKPINRYYSDPRDCRLFHYCTSGYTKNQLLDMKFVCDLGTYFDDERLICTKIKPARCL